MIIKEDAFEEFYIMEAGNDDNEKLTFIPFSLESDTGWILGSYQIYEQRICISNVSSTKRGTMKEFIAYLIKKFNTNHILFYNVIGKQMLEHVHGFKPIFMADPHYGEEVFCLEGTWSP